MNAFKNELMVNVVQNIFPSLSYYDQLLLNNYLFGIISEIYVKFNIYPNEDLFIRQLRSNNFRDSIGLLLLLLPYINDDSGKNKKNLKSFTDLISKKINNININLGEPKYVYTNFQYGRCLRNNKIATEIAFDYNFILNNYILLLKTINTIRNKLYVNWTNILPVSPLHFVHLQYYKSTVESIRSHNIQEINPFFISPDSIYSKDTSQIVPMDLGEIYNIFSNFIFHSIKDIKWLIYDVKKGGDIYKFIAVLHSFVNLDNILLNLPWNELSGSNKNNFNNQWKKLLVEYNENDIIKYVVRVITIFFDRRFSKNNSLEGYIPLPDLRTINNLDIEDLFDEDNEEELINNTLDSNIINTAKSIPIEFLYEFFLLSFVQLENTYFGQFYIYYDNYTRKLVSDPYAYLNFKNVPQQKLITIKNIYNYAKSLVSFTKNNRYIQYPKFWCSLTNQEKKIISNRINWSDNRNILSWFNIMRYLTTRLLLKKEEAITTNINIHNEIQQNLLIFICFDCLSKQGLLNTFQPNLDLTENKNLPSNSGEKNSYILKQLQQKIFSDKDPEFQNNSYNSYYFINNKKFVDTMMRNKNYLEILTDPNQKIGSWITTYAMDWISQISFFHRFINNRIIYVTGSTGVGKSTQIPKLLLYGLKMINYQNTGSIACTQPRIKPTVGNARRIADEMGIPITDSDPKNSNSNYFIQYKYQGPSYEKNLPILYLKIMTDGSLYTQINPVLKKTFLIKDELNFSTNNLYDIIIVDEAHEHNKNMDLILTKMKYATYYNNNIKLVILSATMDDDEPTYRRYYREINDNLLYPLDYSLQKLHLDRVNVDRRLHISPPGQTTQSPIYDFYEPNSTPLELILNILDSSSSGDILVFQPGKTEIINLIQEINSNTRPDVIALPFYSELAKEKTDIIENLDSEKFNLTIPKNIPYESNLPYVPIPKGTYKRIIIVATNIAEASITINSLKYVIDTGSQKVNIFNPNIREDQLVLTNISEQSRIQRRGRVGRVSSGSVFYTYEKDKMINNKKKYDISISDLSILLFDLLRDSPSDNSPLFDFNNDPNILNNLSTNTKYSHGLDKMIMSQYFFNSLPFTYIGNPNYYDYNNNSFPFLQYSSGFSKTTLDDAPGSFYIVHPDELCFKRNVLGIIISIIVSPDCSVSFVTNTNYPNNIKSDKINIFWMMLYEKHFISLINSDFTKTSFGINLYSLLLNLNTSLFSYKSLISFTYSIPLQIRDSIIKIIAMYNSVKSSKEILSFTSSNNIIKYDTKLLNFYSTCSGDSEIFLNIANLFLKYISLEPRQVLNYPKLSYSKEKNMLMSEHLTNEDEFNPILINIFTFFKKNNILDIKTINKEEIIKTLSDENFKLGEINLDSDRDKIINFCNVYNLDFNHMHTFLKNYIELIIKIETYNFLSKNNKKLVKLDWFNENNMKINKKILFLDKKEKIKSCLLFGYSFNVMRFLNNTNNYYLYINIFSLKPKNIINIKKFFRSAVVSIDSYDSNLLKPNNNPNDTFINNKCLDQYILYIYRNDSGISLIENISIDLIKKCLSEQLKFLKNDFNLVKKITLDNDSKEKKNIFFDSIYTSFEKNISSLKNDLFQND